MAGWNADELSIGHFQHFGYFHFDLNSNHSRQAAAAVDSWLAGDDDRRPTMDFGANRVVHPIAHRYLYCLDARSTTHLFSHCQRMWRPASVAAAAAAEHRL